MVGAGYFIMVDGDVLLGAELVDQLLHSIRRNYGVCHALNHDARSGAGGEEAEIVHVRWWRNRDEAPDFWTTHQQLHADQRAKAVACDPGGRGFGMDRLHPIQRCCGVGKFADAVVEAALAAAYAAKVEAQRGKATVDECFVHRLRDAIIHRATRLRVRMEDHGDGRAGARTGLETAFEAAFGTGKDDCGHCFVFTCA